MAHWIRFEENDLPILGLALGELPFKMVGKLARSIEEQLDKNATPAIPEVAKINEVFERRKAKLSERIKSEDVAAHVLEERLMEVKQLQHDIMALLRDSGSPPDGEGPAASP